MQRRKAVERSGFGFRIDNGVCVPQQLRWRWQRSRRAACWARLQLCGCSSATDWCGSYSVQMQRCSTDGAANGVGAAPSNAERQQQQLLAVC